MFENSTQMVGNSLTEVWSGFFAFIPELIAALVVFIVGWIIASVLGRVVDQIFKSLKLDGALRKAGLEDVLNKAGFHLDTGRFLGGLVKWFFIVVFLVASLDILGLDQVNTFLKDDVLAFLPQVIVAILIMLVSIIIAEAMKNLVVASAKAADMPSGSFLGTLTKWAIWIFAAIVSLFQLGVAGPFLQTLFTGVIVALSLAFGLAFGLGGQSAAAAYIEKLKKEMGTHN